MAKKSAKKTSKKRASSKKSTKKKAKPAAKKLVAPKKRAKHKYHHHIRYGLIILAVLTVLLLFLNIFAYYNKGDTTITVEETNIFNVIINSLTFHKSTAPEIIATVNGENITQADIDEQYAKIPAEFSALVTKDILLEQLINERVLLQKAAEKGLSATDVEVDEIIEGTKIQLGFTDEDLDERLAEQGMTLEELKDLYKKQLIITKLVEEDVLPNIEVTDEELREFYDSRIHARHILLNTEEEAVTVIQELNDGADFAELSAERSEDPGSLDGDLGEFGKGQMVVEFEEAAYALDINEITQEPVETQFGYHVIQRLPRLSTFDEAKDDLTAALQSQKQNDAITNYLAQVKAEADIDIVGSVK